MDCITQRPQAVLRLPRRPRRRGLRPGRQQGDGGREASRDHRRDAAGVVPAQEPEIVFQGRPARAARSPVLSRAVTVDPSDCAAAVRSHGSPVSSHSRREEARPLPWWQGLDRYCWIVLVIAALGWLFDTMDQNLFNLVRDGSPSKTCSATPARSARSAVTVPAGWVTAVFLVGWSAGRLHLRRPGRPDRPHRDDDPDDPDLRALHRLSGHRAQLGDVRWRCAS